MATRTTASGKEADSRDGKHRGISKEWKEVILLFGFGVCIATWVLYSKAILIGFSMANNIFQMALFETIFVVSASIGYVKKMGFTWPFRKKLL